jgi:hypothetical protein
VKSEDAMGEGKPTKLRREVKYRKRSGRKRRMEKN